MSTRPQTLLLPVQPWFVWASLLAALFLNLLPWRNNGWMLQPDFVALMLLYWNLYEPDRVSIGWGFVFGLLMDIADASLFGQHALAYVVMQFLSIQLNRRMRMFGLWKQAVHLLPVLLFGHLLMFSLRLAAGGSFPGWSYFLAPITGTLIWPMLTHLLQWPQRRSRESELG